MAIALRILPGDRTLEVPSGTTILRAAHAAGVDITATCGGRGRCTSCRVKFIEGAVPPPTIMDELQLGGDLVRDGYRLSCRGWVTGGARGSRGLKTARPPQAETGPGGALAAVPTYPPRGFWGGGFWPPIAFFHPAPTTSPNPKAGYAGLQSRHIEQLTRESG